MWSQLWKVLCFRFFMCSCIVAISGCQRSQNDSVPASKNSVPESSVVAGAKFSEHCDISPPPKMTESSLQGREPEFKILPPNFSQLVTAGLALSHLESGKQPSAELWLKVMVAAGHHIYSPSVTKCPFQPLAIELNVPPDMEFDGDWIFPPAEKLKGHDVYYDSVVLRRKIRAGAENAASVSGIVSFQVCNEEVCFPPSQIKVSLYPQP